MSIDPNGKQKSARPAYDPDVNLQPSSIPVTTMPVQQQQAFLKILGQDIGKSGLDGIAGKGSQTQKALDDFATKRGIDPKDTAKVNQTLQNEALTSHSRLSMKDIQKELEGWKSGSDEIKTVQWLMKANGAKMSSSLHGGKMDGIAGGETKNAVKETYESLERLQAAHNAEYQDAGVARGRGRAYGAAANRAVSADDPMSMFKENLRDMLSPLNGVFMEIAKMIKQELGQIAGNLGVKGGLSGEFGRAVSGGMGLNDVVMERAMMKPKDAEPVTPQAPAGMKLG